MTERIKPLTEGKTKRIVPFLIIQEAKDDLTAGDGAKHDVLPGKAQWATATTCNNFALLRARGVPVAFCEQIDETRFTAHYCAMLPFEVVVRREVQGKNFPPRRPDLSVGHRFDPPLVEFFLKTRGRRWHDAALPCDDPLVRFDPARKELQLFLPTQPEETGPFRTLPFGSVFAHDAEWELVAQMEALALRAFFILERAWAKLDFTLADIKFEFGVDALGTLRLADVVDNDSGRLMYHGKHASKEIYRQGDTLEEVAAAYERVARASALLE